MNIGRKMALRRKEIHMTPAKVAMLCGMLPAEYKLIESGKKDPTLAELQNIAEALRHVCLNEPTSHHSSGPTVPMSLS